MRSGLFIGHFRPYELQHWRNVEDVNEGAVDMNSHRFGGAAFVVGNHVTGEMILPSKYRTYVPSIPEEYMYLAGFAMSGLPKDQYSRRLLEPGHAEPSFAVIIAGKEFGAGEIPEYLPRVLAAAGVRAVIADSFGRSFYRTCIETGALYPLDTEYPIHDAFQTGDCVEINLRNWGLRDANSSIGYPLRPLDEARRSILESAAKPPEERKARRA